MGSYAIIVGYWDLLELVATAGSELGEPKGVVIDGCG